jgi:uncharacterized protein
VCAAALVGISLGLLGGCGSILTVPTLHYLFGVEGHAAITSSLLVVGVTSAVALIPHLRARRVQGRVALVFGASSMLSAYGAGRLSSLVAPGFLQGSASMLYRSIHDKVLSLPASTLLYPAHDYHGRT